MRVFLNVLCLTILSFAAKAQVVCDSSAYTQKHPVLVAAGSNMIANNGFETGNLDYWKDDAFGMGYYPVPTSFTRPNPALTVVSGFAHTGTYAAKLNLPANPNLTEVEVRQSLPTLAFGATNMTTKTYTVTAWMRAVNATTPSVDFNVLYMDNGGKWAKQVKTSPVYHPTTAYAQYSWSFTITSPYAGVPLRLQNLNLQIHVTAGGVYLDDVVVNAQGGEWSPISSSVPTVQTATFSETFTGTIGTPLDNNKWLVVQKQWGGTNNGVVPELLELQCGYMRFHGHGTTYSGSVTGEDGINVTRVGSSIATKEYYASGRYDIVARIAPGGIVSAFWPYHYIEDATYGFDFPNGWATIQNTEIDWEFPSNLRCPSTPSGATVFDANCNTYGSKCDGLGLTNSPNPYDPESTGYSWRENISSVTGADASAGFHTYTIIWHTGGPGIPASVEWLIDGVSIRKETRQHYVPYRAARLWLGVWYGKSCWTGPQNHSDIYMDVKSVTIQPFNEANDRYENESDPFVGYLNTYFYPAYASSCPLPVTLTSFNARCLNNSTQLLWTTAQEINSSYFNIEKSIDGINYAAVGSVVAMGDKSTATDYQFTVEEPEGRYYRLKQVDRNGNVMYSGVVYANCVQENILVHNDEGILQIDISNLSNDKECTVSVYKVNGVRVYEHNFELHQDLNTIRINEDFSSGMYLVRVQKVNKMVTEKIIF